MSVPSQYNGFVHIFLTVMLETLSRRQRHLKAEEIRCNQIAEKFSLILYFLL